MKLYLAGTSSRKSTVLKQPKYIPFALESFYTVQDWQIGWWKSGHCERFMFDSGAFTFMEDGDKANINLMEYARNYGDFLADVDAELFFELDVDAVRSLDSVEKYREEIEQRTEKQSIPVWHPSRGQDYWIRLIKDYDYVALGGIASGEWSGVPDKTYNWFLNQAHKHDTEVHGLGIGSASVIAKYDFDSVDTTSWLGAKYGKIYDFVNGEMESETVTDGRLMTPDVYEQNLDAWIKWSKHLANGDDFDGTSM